MLKWLIKAIVGFLAIALFLVLTVLFAAYLFPVFLPATLVALPCLFLWLMMVFRRSARAENMDWGNLLAGGLSIAGACLIGVMVARTLWGEFLLRPGGSWWPRS